MEGKYFLSLTRGQNYLGSNTLQILTYSKNLHPLEKTLFIYKITIKTPKAVKFIFIETIISASLILFSHFEKLIDAVYSI